MKKQILTINPQLNIGTGDVELYLDVTGPTGEVIISKKADSLVANFLKVLYSFMSSEHIPGDMLYLDVSSSSDLEDEDSYIGNISNITVGATTVITHASVFYNNVGDYIQIYGISGITPDINGYHEITARTNTTTTINVSTSGTYVNQGARARILSPVSDSLIRSSLNTFTDAVIRVGRSATANVTDQQWLINEYDESEGAPGETWELEYTFPIVSTPAFNYTNKTAEINFSAIVTNNSGASVDINEVGLFMKVYQASFDHRYALMARDVLPSTLVLGDGASITVNYRIQTVMGASSGFTDLLLNGIKILQDPLTSRSLTDIFGSTFSTGESSGAFLAIGPSGNGFVNTTLSGARGQYVGLQVGTGNTAVAMDDRDLDARVEHGSGSGQMIHYGTIVDNYQIVGTTASFDLTKIFENRSGGTIGINEVGLVTAMSSGSGSLGVTCLLTRHVLPVTIDVDDGEIFKFVYTINLEVA
jgi:hypothetical protein